MFYSVSTFSLFEPEGIRTIVTDCADKLAGKIFVHSREKGHKRMEIFLHGNCLLHMKFHFIVKLKNGKQISIFIILNMHHKER